VDYYAVPANMGGGYGIASATENLIAKTPVLTGNWVKKLTFGSSLNGQEFQVDQGASYAGIADDTTYAVANAAKLGETGFVGTSLSILSGTNASTMKTHDGRVLHHVVHTGWTPANGTVSDIVTIWGLVDFAAAQSDSVTVSVSYPEGTDPATIVLGARDPKTGAWLNAVDTNIVGGVKSLKTASNGAYNSSYGLGSYGVNTDTHTVWAVVNGNARDFAVINTTSATLPWDFDGDGKVTTLDLGKLMTAIQTHSTDSKYDLNGDGKVDVSDTRWLVQHYTKVGGAQ